MARKGENIYKRKDGRYEGRYIKEYDFNGKAKYGYIYGKTYAEVKKRLIRTKADVKSGEKIISSSLKLSEWFDIMKRTLVFIKPQNLHTIPRLTAWVTSAIGIFPLWIGQHLRLPESCCLQLLLQFECI